MTKNVLVPLVVTLSIFIVSAQNKIPHADLTAEMAEEVAERQRANKTLLDAGIIQLRNDIIYVPIKFHLIAKNDGSSRVKEAKILDMLCATNKDYEDLNIQFFIKEDFNYIDNDAVYDDHLSAQRGVMSFSKDNQAINVFTLENVSENPFVGGYYTPRYDWIVLRNNEVNSNYVLSHEIGHFFSLLHPFNGWDDEGFRPEEQGEKVPELSPRGVVSEKADGSNCEEAGDFICDTPADYNAFGSNCNPPITILDPDSIPIQPDKRLIMSYYQCESRNEYFFTDEQRSLIAVDLNSPSRRGLVNADPSTTELITGSVTGLVPGNLDTIGVINGARFQWEAVENANRYLVEIDRLPNFSNSISIVSEETSIIVDDLISDANYFWRVLPYNEYSTCSNFSRTNRFYAGAFAVSTSQIESIDEWTIFPNPVVNSDQINFSITAKSRTSGIVSLYNGSGQEVLRMTDQQLQPGINNIMINTRQLEAGLFTVKFLSNEGYLSDKVIVLK